MWTCAPGYFDFIVEITLKLWHLVRQKLFYVILDLDGEHKNFQEIERFELSYMDTSRCFKKS